MDLGRRVDKDPILSRQMKSLKTTEDKPSQRAQPHKDYHRNNIETDTYRSVDDLLSAVEEGRCEKGNERGMTFI